MTGMAGPRSWSGFDSCTVILFDLDDTILDFSGSTELCWQAVCTDTRCNTSGLSAADLQRVIATTADRFWSDPERHRIGRQDLRTATRSIVRDALLQLGVNDIALSRAIADQYRDLREDSVSLLQGADATLECLYANGFRLGLITNEDGTGQRAKIERFALARHFEYIGIEGEVGYGKPDPEAYLTALRALGSLPQTTCMVGDNFEWDVAAPQRLNMRAVWVNALGR